jgi:hypothetical protein
VRALGLAGGGRRGWGDAVAGAAHDAPLQPLVPTTVAYHWQFMVPQWVVEHRVVRAPASLEWDAGHVDYALPEFAFVSRRIGSLPHFECKYVDFWLPNTCTTTWRDVYVDVPVARVGYDRLDVDVPRWNTPGNATIVDVPHLEWKPATLDVTLPALARPGCASNADRRCPR